MNSEYRCAGGSDPREDEKIESAYRQLFLRLFRFTVRRGNPSLLGINDEGPAEGISTDKQRVFQARTIVEGYLGSEALWPDA